MSTTTVQPDRLATALKSYRAAVVHEFGSPLSVEAVPAVGLKAGQVRVKVEATGLCHTDIHAACGDWPVKPSPPFVPGPRGRRHRRRARARRDGGGARRSRRDAVARLRLRALRSLRVRLGDALPRAEEHGLLFDGTFGEYATAYARYVVQGARRRRPLRRRAADLRGRDDVQGRQGRRARARRISSRCSASAGSAISRSSTPRSRGRVIAVDIHEEKLTLARELGAEFTINALEEDPIEAIQKLGGADQAIALAVAPKAFEQAYGSLRRGGTLVFVALPADNEVKIPIFETVLNGITIVGSIVGTRAELRDVFALHAAGRTTVIRETRPLDAVNEAIADVEAGRVAARIVLEP